MAVYTIDESQRKAARVAGFFYLFTMAIVSFAYLAIETPLIVTGNAAETARNILAHERLFRINIACDVIYVAGVVVLLSALYVILRPVNRSLALIGSFWRLVYGVLWAITALSLLDVLRILSGADYLRVFEPDRVQALARLYFGTPAYAIGLPFYGLGSAAISYLWFKSRYIPRALGAWGLVASVWCAACGFAFIIYPEFAKTVNAWWFDTPMAAFEMVTGFWLLFKGIRAPSVESSMAK